MADLMRLLRPRLLSSLRLRSRTPPPVLSSFRYDFSTASPFAKNSWKRGTGNEKPRAPILSLLIPRSFVVPPLWRFPRDPRKFFHMLWLVLKIRILDLRTLVSMKFMSMDKSKFSRPRFQAGKSAAVPAAKALHIQMSKAMAAGDKETLRSICTQELYQTLAGAIDSRPRDVSSKWELVCYEKFWRYPRLADWKIAFQPVTNDGSLVKQAIVSIASVQRIARYDDSKGGVLINGSERVRHMVEHIVMQSSVHPITYQAGPWKIWGTIPETTYESMIQHIEDYDILATGFGSRAR
ncbi:hypothetical protein F5B19DRAFT_500086 [Rostrohypoxylon terebratum]|nr:hypothetical protein F5B19DRAFT_500086 [Rostrohypoxylon terebratum]